MDVPEELVFHIPFENREISITTELNKDNPLEEYECTNCTVKLQGIVRHWTVTRITESGVTRSLTSPFAKRLIAFVKEKLSDEKFFCYKCDGDAEDWGLE